MHPIPTLCNPSRKKNTILHQISVTPHLFFRCSVRFISLLSSLPSLSSFLLCRHFFRQRKTNACLQHGVNDVTAPRRSVRTADRLDQPIKRCRSCSSFHDATTMNDIRSTCDAGRPAGRPTHTLGSAPPRLYLISLIRIRTEGVRQLGAPRLPKWACSSSSNASY